MCRKAWRFKSSLAHHEIITDKKTIGSPASFYFVSVIWFKSSLARIDIIILMQKSLYQNETFAEFWNERAGDSGEVYKRFVLDPLMLRLVGSLKKKTIIELGCGNGY